MSGSLGRNDARINRLCQEMAADGIAAYIAATPISLTYLHGLNESGGERLLIMLISQSGDVRLICPALTANQAARCGVTDILAWADGEDPSAHVAHTAEQWGLESAKIAFDDDMRASHLRLLQRAIPAADFVEGHPILSRITCVKDSDELALLHQTGSIADQAYEAALPQLKAGMTELEIARVLSDEMSARGGTPTFAIVAAGANGAEPHHHSDDTVVKEGDVVIMDFGCDVGGYQSDITRMISFGEPTKEAKEVYQTVLAAHWAGRKAISAGTPYQDLDRAARGVISEAGYGEFFTHRLGHGLGMSVHENPNVVEGNADPVGENHCFSIEPGIYLPGRFGIRIENIVTATADGHVSFNVDPPTELTVV